MYMFYFVYDLGFIGFLIRMEIGLTLRLLTMAMCTFVGINFC
jgi:hypothetical protein